MDPSSAAMASGAAAAAVRSPDAASPDIAMATPAAIDAMAFAFDDAVATDGRVARGQRTRRKVADALVALLSEGEPEPTARAVAEKAGVSLRLVFHHFADIDDLYTFVAAMQLRSEWSILPPVPPDLDLRTRIDRTAAQRATLFEKVAPVRRALARRTSPAVKQAVVAADALLLESLERTFAPELDAMAVEERAERLEALDTVASWEAWDRMRRTSGLQLRTTRRVLACMMAAVCAHQPDSESVTRTSAAFAS